MLVIHIRFSYVETSKTSRQFMVKVCGEKHLKTTSPDAQGEGKTIYIVSFADAC